MTEFAAAVDALVQESRFDVVARLVGGPADGWTVCTPHRVVRVPFAPLFASNDPALGMALRLAEYRQRGNSSTFDYVP